MKRSREMCVKQLHYMLHRAIFLILHLHETKITWGIYVKSSIQKYINKQTYNINLKSNISFSTHDTNTGIH